MLSCRGLIHQTRTDTEINPVKGTKKFSSSKRTQS